MRRVVLMALVGGLALCLVPVRAAQAQWVLLARRAIGRVEQMTQSQKGQEPGYDIATVILSARADRVYATAVRLIGHNPRVHIISEDATRRKVEFGDGQRSAGLTVTPLSDRLSQLLVASSVRPGEESGASIVVDGVLRVCREMKVACHLG